MFLLCSIGLCCFLLCAFSNSLKFLCVVTSWTCSIESTYDHIWSTYVWSGTRNKADEHITLENPLKNSTNLVPLHQVNIAVISSVWIWVVPRDEKKTTSSLPTSRVLSSAAKMECAPAACCWRPWCFMLVHDSQNIQNQVCVSFFSFVFKQVRQIYLEAQYSPT